ncbi:unnamed protein product, partial [marine sediment metagenome]
RKSYVDASGHNEVDFACKACIEVKKSTTKNPSRRYRYTSRHRLNKNILDVLQDSIFEFCDNNFEIPNSLIIHPQQLTDLLQDRNFISSSQYSNIPIEKGEIGRVFGIRVFVSDILPPNEILVTNDSINTNSLLVKLDGDLINPSKRYKVK